MNTFTPLLKKPTGKRERKSQVETTGGVCVGRVRPDVKYLSWEKGVKEGSSFERITSRIKDL